MALESTRRNFLVTAARTASALAAVTLPIAGHALQRTPQPLQSPNAPTNQNVPAGLNNYPEGSSDGKLASGVNAAELKQMIEQLYQLAVELKQESDKTNFNSTLPVDLVQRAQKIEKLAKKIRTRV